MAVDRSLTSAPVPAVTPRRPRLWRASLLLLWSAGLLLPSLASARGFGGGGFGGGGFRGGSFGGAGFHFGGAGYDGRGSVDGWQRGYQGYHPAYGPNARPAWQGGGNPAIKDGTLNRNSINTNINDKFDNDTFQRNVNVNNNFYNRDGNGWNRNWANGGYWNNRPWATGWYGWTPATWGWWGGSAAAWGLAGLATGVAITSLVNTAAAQQQTVIVVPGSSFVLDYGSVEAVGSYGVSFAYNLGQGAMLNGAANCQAGLLNGQVPGTAAQAQLLNAVCQVAYGAGA
ncbi:MAG: hypothetical protein VKK97_08150 [Synechococcaceae cyanobacterium]|nr:hypothetical protein [Synechococcaceae cyanobacterium]